MSRIRRETVRISKISELLVLFRYRKYRLNTRVRLRNTISYESQRIRKYFKTMRPRRLMYFSSVSQTVRFFSPVFFFVFHFTDRQ